MIGGYIACYGFIDVLRPTQSGEAITDLIQYHTILLAIFKTNAIGNFDYVRCICINKFRQCKQRRQGQYYLELTSIEICE